MNEPYRQQPPGGTGGFDAGPPPPPPPPGRAPLRLVPPPPPRPPEDPHAALRAELQAAREELDALQDLLEELPGIFEQKFRQRVACLLGEQRLLMEQNRILRNRLGGAPRPLAQLPEARADQSRVGSPQT
ncbi:MAG: hypothetical protein VKI81_01930 [Synechococcaceae cyanobacterium]|nr:hypothetical protein [Synechococcaceae cyanobacterium]